MIRQNSSNTVHIFYNCKVYWMNLLYLIFLVYLYGMPKVWQKFSALLIISSSISQDLLSWGEVITNCSTFSNWCTRKIPRVSRPWLPTSWRKHEDKPAYWNLFIIVDIRYFYVTLLINPITDLWNNVTLIGKLSGFNHSSLWNAAIGCSEVAIKYFSSTDLSSSRSLPFPVT